MKITHLLVLASLIPFAFGSRILEDRHQVEDNFKHLAREVGNYLAGKYGTSVKGVDFSNSDEIHHRRWCNKKNIHLSVCQININVEENVVPRTLNNCIIGREVTISGELAIWFRDRIDLNNKNSYHHLYFIYPGSIIRYASESDSISLTNLADSFYEYGSD